MNYLTSIVLIIISFVLSFFYTSPLMAEISSLGEERATLNNYLGESKNLRAILEQKGEIYNSFSEEERNTINKILPDSIDSVKLIIDIDDIASKYGMKIRNIDLKTEKDGEGDTSGNAYGTATLRFSVSAPYNNFRLFMGDLEDSLRLMDVSSLSFSAGDKDVNEYDIELKTYWLKETI